MYPLWLVQCFRFFATAYLSWHSNSISILFELFFHSIHPLLSGFYSSLLATFAFAVISSLARGFGVTKVVKFVYFFISSFPSSSVFTSFFPLFSRITRSAISTSFPPRFMSAFSLLFAVNNVFHKVVETFFLLVHLSFTFAVALACSAFRPGVIAFNVISDFSRFVYIASSFA